MYIQVIQHIDAWCESILNRFVMVSVICSECMFSIVFSSLIFMTSGLTLARHFSSTEMFGASRPVAIEFAFLMLFGHKDDVSLIRCFRLKSLLLLRLARHIHRLKSIQNLYISSIVLFFHILINVQMLLIWYIRNRLQNTVHLDHSDIIL